MISFQDRTFGFEMLLASLGVLLFVPGLIPTAWGSEITILLLLAMLVAAIQATARSSRELAAGITMVVLILATSWNLGVLAETLRVAVNALLYIVFLAFVCFEILQFMGNARRMSMQLLYAAVCVYLLAGLAWAFLYVLLLVFDPHAIELATTVAWDQAAVRDVFAEMFYFSFVTLTTLGYGDVLPVSRIARAMATAEAVIGQLYIAIVIASLVGVQINQRGSGGDSAND